MKSVKKVAGIALPIAAMFVPGLQPFAAAALAAGAGVLGSKLQGNSWGDSLKMGAISGLTRGLAPIAGNALSSLAPQTMADIGITGGYNTVFGQGVGGGALSGLSGAAPSASGAALSPGTENFLTGLGAPEQISPALAAADPSLVAGGTSSGGGALSSLFGGDPFKSAAYLATAANALNENPVTGEQTQADILAQQQAKQAQEAAYSKQTVDMLNSANTGRQAITPAISDYYTYGTRPEATFFNRANAPITYKQGALS